MFKIDSDIQLKPFYFNGELTIHDKKIENIIDNIFLYMFLYDENYLGNINGNLKVKLSNLNNKLINKGEIDFYINEKKIKSKNSMIDLGKIGNIETKISFNENQGDIIFSSKNVLYVKNYIEFAKVFQIGFRKLKNLEKIYFDLERNVGDTNFTISNIRINNPDDKKNAKKKFAIKNIQNLRASIKKVIN